MKKWEAVIVVLYCIVLGVLPLHVRGCEQKGIWQGYEPIVFYRPWGFSQPLFLVSRELHRSTLEDKVTSLLEAIVF